MHPLLRVCLASLILTTAGLTGCDKGMRVGSWQVIDAKPLLSATSVQITRRQEGEKPINQKLVIDLSTGRAAFTDTDGRTFPQQIEQNDLTQIRSFIAGRTWQVGTMRPAKDAQTPTHFGLTVYDGDETLKQQAFWASPSRKPVPEGFARLVDAIERAERHVHPLSLRVNLLD